MQMQQHRCELQPSCQSTKALPSQLSAVSWKTALISEYRTEATDRFMWVQEVRPVISTVKSPFGLLWPTGAVGCSKFFLNILEV